MSAVRKLVISSLLIGGTLYGCDRLPVVDSKNDFPETMMRLQDELQSQGYRVLRVQSVDRGMEKAGYHLDKYRIIFFGKPEDLNRVLEDYPAFASFLPLSITVYEEGGQTKILNMPYKKIKQAAPTPDIALLVDTWQEETLTVIQRAAIESP